MLSRDRCSCIQQTVDTEYEENKILNGSVKKSYQQCIMVFDRPKIIYEFEGYSKQTKIGTSPTYTVD